MKYFSLIIIALLFFANTLLYSALPNQIPMHWNINGQIDSYMPKDYGLWLLPIICLIMWISFQIIPYFDPKKEKYQLFAKEWQIMQTGIVVFMSYVHSLILYITLNPQTPMLPPMFFGLGSLFILFGNYLSKIRQNYFIGVKTPWTLADEENWNHTHRYASWTFVLAGIATLLQILIPIRAPLFIFTAIILASALPILYSFLYFKKSTYILKYIYIGLSLAFILIILIQFFIQ